MGWGQVVGVEFSLHQAVQNWGENVGFLRRSPPSAGIGYHSGRGRQVREGEPDSAKSEFANCTAVFNTLEYSEERSQRKLNR